MRTLRVLLTTLLTALLLGVTAYGAGYAVRHLEGPVAPAPVPAPTPDASSEPSQAPSREPAPVEAPTIAPATTLEPQLVPGPALLAAGATGDAVRDLQARLKQIAWLFGDVTGTYDAATIEAVRGFQAKREIPVTGEVDQRTLDRLHAMTRLPSYDEKNNVEPEPGALDPRCLTGRVVCIDKTSRTLRWVVDGQVLKTMDARFGSTVRNTPTREGLFHVYLKSRDHHSQLYDSPMPFALFFSGGQAVHYSADFAATGYNGASHGCVNIRDYDGVAWLFDQVRVGDAVVVYWS